MERLLLTLLAVALLGCGTAEAQMTLPNPGRTAPMRPQAPTLMTTPSPMAVPGTATTGSVTPGPLVTAPSPMAVPGTVTAGSVTSGGLGTVQLYLGILAPFPGASLGDILVCPTTIIGPTSPAAASVAAANAALMASPSASVGPFNPSVSAPPFVPSLPITLPFGTITTSSICNPTATITDPGSLASTAGSTRSLVGNSVAASLASNSTLTSPLVGSPVPLLTPSSTVATPDFSDATVPSGATAPGMSPLISVPPPVLSLTTCAGTTGSSIGGTTTLGIPSPSGC